MFTACGIMHRRCCRPPAGSISDEWSYKYQRKYTLPSDATEHNLKLGEQVAVKQPETK